MTVTAARRDQALSAALMRLHFYALAWADLELGPRGMLAWTAGPPFGAKKKAFDYQAPM